MKLRKNLLAAAVAAVCSAAGMAHAVLVPGPIAFRDEGAGAQHILDTITYAAGNVLMDNLIKAGGLSIDPTAPDLFTLRFQTTVRSFDTLDAGTIAGVVAGDHEYTVQMVVPMSAFLIAGANPTVVISLAGTGSYTMFYDASPDANDVTGLGFGDGDIVLAGDVNSGSGSVTNSGGLGSQCATPGTTVAIDQKSPTNNLPNVVTICTSGNALYAIDVTARDADHFPTLGLASEFLIALDLTTSHTNPFSTVNPSREVVGVSPNYGAGTTASGVISVAPSGETVSNRAGRNDFACTVAPDTGDVPCDFHAQSDSSTSFRVQVVPEPGSVALLGLGLGLFGMMSRRRRKTA